MKGRVNDWANIQEEDKGEEIEKLLKDEKSLDFVDLGISNLDNFLWLSSLVNLTSIDFSLNQIVDISPISSLVNLTSIKFTANEIVDISPISSLVNLTYADLSSTKVIDISPISSLTKLTYINLSFNQIIDVSPLSSLIKLKTLHIGAYGIKEENIVNAKIANSSADIFKNLFFIADKISINANQILILSTHVFTTHELSSPLYTYTGIWIRQGTSNIFDAQWSRSDGITSTETIYIRSVSYIELTSTWIITLEGIGSYYGEVSSDGQQFLKGTMNGTVDGSPSWTAKITT